MVIGSAGEVVVLCGCGEIIGVWKQLGDKIIGKLAKTLLVELVELNNNRVY